MSTEVGLVSLSWRASSCIDAKRPLKSGVQVIDVGIKIVSTVTFESLELLSPLQHSYFYRNLLVPLRELHS